MKDNGGGNRSRWGDRDVGLIPEKGEGRKEDGVGRASRHSVALGKSAPGRWGALEQTLAIREIPCPAGMAQLWCLLPAQSLDGKSLGRVWPPWGL